MKYFVLLADRESGDWGKYPNDDGGYEYTSKSAAINFARRLCSTNPYAEITTCVVEENGTGIVKFFNWTLQTKTKSQDISNLQLDMDEVGEWELNQN